jgi:hypothetical protein
MSLITCKGTNGDLPLPKPEKVGRRYIRQDSLEKPALRFAIKSVMLKKRFERKSEYF